MKKQLLEMLAKKQARKTALADKAQGSQSVEEVRSLMAEIDNVNEEITQLNSLIASTPDEQTPAERTTTVNSQLPPVVAQPANRSVDLDSQEYRKAFMNYVQRGIPIPAELRLDANTLTSDVATVIPTVLVNRIVEAMKTVGTIWNRINKTSFAAGVNIPTSSLRPVATWVNEGAGSDRQKKTTSYVTFTYHKLRCEISMSMEVGAMALSAFEDAFVRQVSEAMILEIETKVLSDANGTTSNKGILAETPETGQALTTSELNWDDIENMEAALPYEYESGAEWLMTKKTFYEIQKLKDAEGQPIARVNYGITGLPERVLSGRPVVIVNSDMMETYSASLTSGKVFAILFRLRDYTLNTVYDMGISRKQDWDTEDLLTKAVMSVDGKVVDKGSLVTLAKA